MHVAHVEPEVESAIAASKTIDLLTNWFKEFPGEILKADAPRDFRVMRKGREFVFRRTPLREAGYFLLQIDDLSRADPGRKME